MLALNVPSWAAGPVKSIKSLPIDSSPLRRNSRALSLNAQHWAVEPAEGVQHSPTDSSPLDDTHSLMDSSSLHDTRLKSASLNRRAILGGLGFAALGSATSDADAAESSFAPEAAIEIVRKGATCSTSNCAKKALKDATPLLDTTGLPTVKLEPPPQILNKALYGLRKDVSMKSKVVISTTQRPEVMWLVDKATGEVLVARAYQEGEEAPYTCTGVFSGKVGLPVAAKVYSKAAGLWESETFELVRPT